jgi:hypothetical protein
MKNFLKLCDIHRLSPKEVFDMAESKSDRQVLLNEPGSVLFKKKRNKK